ncbi:MAG: peptidylprolyl isomerase [Nitriliruptoraceae bacterium]
MSKRSSSRGRDPLERRSARSRVVIVAMAVLLGLSLLAIPISSLLGNPTEAPEVDDTGQVDATEEAASGPGPCGETPDDVPEPDSRIYDAPFEQTIEEDGDYTATLVTTCGEVVIELDASAAPLAVNNLVNLAEDGYFDGVVFHRVVPGFVVQSGDPAGTGCGQEDCDEPDQQRPPYPGYTFADELEHAEELYAEVLDQQVELFRDDDAVADLNEEELREQVPGGYPRGTVAMANAGPDTNGSQFFIVQGDPAPLEEPAFTVFGTVVDGMDVVDDIAASPTDGSGRPDEPPVIETVRIDGP